MFKIQHKLLLYVVLISIIPLLAAMFFSYNQFMENTKANVVQATIESFEQIDDNIFLKTNRVQNALDFVFSNKRVHEILRETNFNILNTDSFLATKELDSIFSQICTNVEQLKGVIVFSTNGGFYSYRCFLNNMDVVSFTMKYGRVGGIPGEITWLGAVENPEFTNERSVDMMGTLLHDTNHIRDQKLLATIYLVFENDYFKNDLTTMDSSLVMMYDESGKLMASKGQQKFTDIWKIAPNVGKEIFSREVGNFKAKLGDEMYFITFYKAPSTGWRYVRAVVYDQYFKNYKNVQLFMLLLVICVLGTILLVNYYFVRMITKPINEIVYAMKEVGNHNFDITMNVESNDEYAVISDGFNSMVSQLDELFTRVVQEERKRKDADIMALSYQITPHFLYNTLSSIRFSSYSRGEYETSQMLQIMGRFLRNTINTAGRMVTIGEELKNIEDYIALYQIRNENKFLSTYEVDESICDCRIPAMLIQPLVENAIFHGLSTRLDTKCSAEVKVTAGLRDNNIVITIWDNGAGIPRDKIDELCRNSDDKHDNRTHIGISNIRSRIFDMFGDGYGLNIKSVVGEFTQVEIVLPQIKEEQ